MFNLANKLTLLRMLLVPLVIVLLYFQGPVTCVLAALAFIAASITDWADGYVARRNNMVTSMGKFLDPLADKVLICSVLIMFCTLGWAEAWVVILIVCRELVVTGHPHAAALSLLGRASVAHRGNHPLSGAHHVRSVLCELLLRFLPQDRRKKRCRIR